jgi:hypothetical protein
MYEARCRRCFEPLLAHEKIEELKENASIPPKVHAATS